MIKADKLKLNEGLDRIYGELCKTSDLADVIAIAAHGAAEFSDKDKCLGAIRTASEIMSERIHNSMGELETLKRK